MKALTRPGPLLAGILIVVNALAVCLGAASLHQSRNLYEAQAQIQTHNIANAIDQSVTAHVDRIDLSLRSVAEELERQLAQGGIRHEEMTAFLLKHEERLPELIGFLVSNAEGGGLLGHQIGPASKVSWAGRDYFIYLRDHPDGGLQMSKPVMGVVNKRPLIVFARRYNYPDGRFAGVVIAPVALTTFADILSKFDIGPQGVAVLRRSDDFSQIARFPDIQTVGAQVGSVTFSDSYRSMANTGADSATYHAIVPSDHIERRVTIKRVQIAPIIISVGEATDDYMADWYRRTQLACLLYAGFALLSLGSGLLMVRVLKESDRQAQAIRDSEARLNAAQAVAHLGSYEWHAPSNVTYWSDEIYRLMGLEPGSAAPSTELFLRHVHPKDLAAVEAGIARELAQGNNFELRYRLCRADGSERFIRNQGRILRDSSGQAEQVIGLAEDVTEEMAAQVEQRIAAVAFESHEMMAILNAHKRIVRVNSAYTEVTGREPSELLGKLPQRIDPESPHFDAERAAELERALEQTGRWEGELTVIHKLGAHSSRWMTMTAVKNAEGIVVNYVVTLQDISEHKKALEKINNLAFYDQLTGLPNRTLLLERLNHAMTNSARSNSYSALLFIDLDNFKTLNDTQGHDVGDLLLKQVAQEMSNCVREIDTVARLGGDEFVVLLESVGTDSEQAADAVRNVGEKLLLALSRPFQSSGAAHRNSASIGITMFRDKSASRDELMKQADLAMYRSKEGGRNALHFFDPEMEAAVANRVAMEAELRRALAAGEFELHYQAQVSDDNLVVGAEALVRWRHPVRGLVLPGEFIPLAEATGLISDLGAWVLQSACRQLVQWSSIPELVELRLAINVSAQQFRRNDFVDEVLAELKRAGAASNRLKLELTESMLIDDMEKAIVKMRTLQGQGVHFALDDFGTGYSSLAYLKRLPIDQLKIDRSFVRDVLEDANDAAIARTIVALAESLDIEVIAEGVETEAQRVFLIGIGCTAYQGYLHSRPLPADAFEASLLARADATAAL